jgi:hypothetical protein
MPYQDTVLIPQDHDMASQSDEEADEVERALIEDGVAEKRMALAAFGTVSGICTVVLVGLTPI